MERPGWIDDIEVVGWDLDGTLYPPDSIAKGLIDGLKIRAVAEANGWDEERAEREFERAHGELGSNTKALTKLGVDGVGFFTDVWDEIGLEEFIKEDKRIAEMFERLAHWRHFLLSNSNRPDQIERKLGLIGLEREVFEVVVSTVELGAIKPEPEPFLVCLERMGGVRAERVLYVGDRVNTDVRGAKGVGMRTCLVWGESDEADVCLESVYEVVGLVNG